MKEKIIFVGHSYHKKTTSHQFMLDYLCQFYDIEDHYDDSWNKGAKINLAQITKNKHQAIIFWQIFPELEFIKNYSGNVIYFPMFGAIPIIDLAKHFNSYKYLKILSFSLATHKLLESFGYNSYYIQYFPKPQELSYGKENKVFFWQRVTNINIKTITKILQNIPCSIHIHKAIDPLQQFISPTKEDEKKFDITYSNWQSDKDNLHQIMSDAAIYIAPRSFEGIGMSFLEAMAMGKCVISHDNSTMNEYIIHDKTGFLYNFNKPKSLKSIPNIRKIQENAHEFIKTGYNRWLEDRKIITEIINNHHPKTKSKITSYFNRSKFLASKKISKLIVNITCWFITDKNKKDEIRGRTSK